MLRLASHSMTRSTATSSRRLFGRSSSSVLYSRTPKRSGTATTIIIPYRTFFFHSGGDNNNNNNNNNNNKGRRKHASSSSSSSNNDNDNDNSSDDDNNDPNDVVVTAAAVPSSLSSSSSSKALAFGEGAPRLPHTTALPLVSRPLFPGMVSSITITDPATIDALERKLQKDAFVSTFLRCKHSTGMTDGGVLLQTPEVITDASEIYSTGTFAQIQRLTRGLPSSSSSSSSSSHGSHENGADSDDSDSDTADTANAPPTSATLTLLAHRRVDLVSVDDLGPPIDVTIKHWPRMEFFASAGSDNNHNHDDTIRALINEIISTIRQVAQMNPLFRESLTVFPMQFDANDPYKLADFCASISASGSPQDLQDVLEERHAERRLHKALVLLNREREVSKLQKEISSKVEEKMTEAQRKYFLTEQLKSIKKELGMERDDKDALMEKYRQTLAEYPDVPTEVMETIQAELEKFSTLEKNSPEFNVTRSYLDWLVGVPWGVTTKENFDIGQARCILNRDHYGLDDVKDAILQFIAIGKLKGGSVQGKILCLAGPPGTGKTSIAKSVADALGRKFYRFSVGGLSDVSEIKGHRRTYVGAIPGKLIQCLKTTGTTNPVVLIDEIDKLGTGFRGDPASALLEVLDPSQNSTFRDHFLDVPVDISKALFICTANELERIPGPLLDRMEVIKLSGYDFPEKVAIAEQYLVPKSMRESGLMKEKESVKDEEGEGDDDKGKDEDGTKKKKKEPAPVGTPLDNYVHSDGIPDTLEITMGAVKSLVRWYAREAGVRSLEKYIGKITRKLALQVVAEEEGAELTGKSERKSDSWVVSEDNLADYVGKPVFTSDRLYEDGPLPFGVVMGLAYTSMGGSALYIETQGINRALDSQGKTRGGGTVKVTGQLGEVMKESADIAYTVARARLAQVDPQNDFFDKTDIHMHVPEGATPKDGPSAGITMVTSMLSLAQGKSIPNDLAMTGEISLTGKVLPVGGIKEKIMGARRSGITKVILPSANERDFEEIPEYLKEGLDVHFAEEYDKVYEVVFS